MIKQELDKLNITREGMTFTPRYIYTEITKPDNTIEFDYTVTATAEQVYQEYQAQKNATPQPTVEQIVERNITDIEIANIKRDRQLTDLEIACLKKGVVI